MARCCWFHATSLDRWWLKKPSLPAIFESKWICSPLADVRYVMLGQRHQPAVILMPDPPNSIEQMAPLIDLLSNDFLVIAFDSAGFGYSRAKCAFNFSLAHNAQIITEVIESLQLKQVILAMTCVGALPALQVARHRPDLVKGLVLGQVPSMEAAKRWAKNVDVAGLLGKPYLGQTMLRFMRDRVSKGWYEAAFPKGYDSNPHYLQTMDSYKRGAVFSLASAFQALKSDETKTSDLIVETNAVVMWGALDRTHRKTNKHGVMDYLPNGKFIELPDTGHFPDIEAPERFADAVRSLA